MGKALTKQNEDVREKRWLARVKSWPLDTPSAVTDAMGKVLRAWCSGIIREPAYKMLFAGLREIRAGRETEITMARGGTVELPEPFIGLTVIYTPEKEPQPSKGEGDAEEDAVQ